MEVRQDVNAVGAAMRAPKKMIELRVGLRLMPFNSDSNGTFLVKLIQSLASLQTRLNHLESQNLTSRRRIRELELELETCKLEVKREKMKALEKEEIIVTQQRDFQRWKSDMKHSLHHNSDAEERYQEVMAEKKGEYKFIANVLRP